MENKQTLLFRLYQVLCNYSDSEHPLTQKRIIDLLNRDYGLIVERKAIGRNMSYLKEMGYEIFSNKQGSYIDDKPFESSELRLLIDSVLGSSHINATYSKQLIDKLIAMGGQNFKAHVKHVYSVTDWNKTKNYDFFLNVDLVDEAIENEKQLCFDYNKMGIDKKLHKTANHKVSPYLMMLHNQHYYLMAFNEKKEEMVYYRMDKITNMKVLDDTRRPLKSIDGYRKGINYKELSTAHPYMFSDRPERIIIKAEQWLIDDIIDWFGEDIKITPCDGKVKIELQASPNAMKYWAMQYGAFVEVLAPQSVREAIKNTINSMQEKYND